MAKLSGLMMRLLRRNSKSSLTQYAETLDNANGCLLQSVSQSGRLGTPKSGHQANDSGT